MLFKNLLLSALVAVGASAHAVRKEEIPSRPFTCGTHDPDAEHIGMSKILAAQEAKAALRVGVEARATINVKVYIHVVAASTALVDGYVTDKMLTDQLAVLNTDFAPYGVAFTSAGTDRTINTGWASDSDELAMKKALRKGTYSDLNLYFQKALVDDNLGYAYLPTSAVAGSTAYIRDGVSIDFTTVPGGSFTGYNLGKTTVHEVGHWMGLYHTFQGGCTGNGDLVADTPPQASYSVGCPIGRDSCPGGGVDPIHNYMDYSTDACYTEFTAGQQTRMTSFWNTYRG